MSKTTIIESNSSDKDNVRVLVVKGEKGENNTLTIGEVTTAENQASASITGQSPNQVLNLGLPKGDPNTLSIGTVTKGENASATITGQSPNQVLNLVLPKGDKGDKGDTGDVNASQIYYGVGDRITISNMYDPEILISGYKFGTDVYLNIPTKKMINNSDVQVIVDKLQGTFRKVDGTLIGTAGTDYANTFSFTAFPLDYQGGNFIKLDCGDTGNLFNGIADYTQINFFATEIGIEITNLT